MLLKQKTKYKNPSLTALDLPIVTFISYRLIGLIYSEDNAVLFYISDHFKKSLYLTIVNFHWDLKCQTQNLFLQTKFMAGKKHFLFCLNKYS